MPNISQVEIVNESVPDLKDPDALEAIDVDKVDLSLSLDYSLQVMVRQRLQHVVNYNIANINYRASKSLGNERETKRLSEAMTVARMTVALIDNLWPTAKAGMKKLTETEKPTSENIDTDLPKEYLDKVMARQRLQHLLSLKAAELSHKATQAVGMDDAERLAKVMAAESMAIALIDKEHKGAKELMLSLCKDGTGLL